MISGLHMNVSGEGHFKWLDTKYKTLFVYKHTLLYKVLYKQQTTIQIPEADNATTTSTTVRSRSQAQLKQYNSISKTVNHKKVQNFPLGSWPLAKQPLHK